MNSSDADAAAPVHVLHVVPGLEPGGMELAMSRVLGGLSAGPMRHSIACLKGDPVIRDQLPAGVEVYCLYSRPNEPALAVRLWRLIRRVRPTVIHARNWGAWPDVAVARLFCRRPVPFIFSFHGLGKAGYMPLRRRLASCVLARLTTYLFTVSEASRQMLIERFGWPPRRVAVIPNGVDTARFTPGRAAAEPGPPRPGARRLVVGTVGNLRPVKNHALLLRSCARLAAGGVDLEVRIAGEGAERPRLLALADELHMRDRLRLEGYVPDVPRFLQGLDVFVLSSDSEQHPNALIEAMACGAACVATRVGSVEEVLEGGAHGRILPPGHVEAMAAAVGELAGDADLRGRLGAAARERACARYSLDQMIAAYGRLYRDLSARRLRRA